jgi:hypothetical protein
MDLTDNRLVEMAASNRPTRRPRIEYAGLRRHSSDGKIVGAPRLAKLVQLDRKEAGYANIDDGANGTLEEWYHEQECVFGIAGYGEHSNVITAPRMSEKRGDTSLMETEMEHEDDFASMPCISVVKRKSRTEMNPTVTVAFKTDEGTAKWTPSVVKELTVLGPMNKFAMVLLEENQIPRDVPILMLQTELTTKRETGLEKCRVVVNGKMEPIQEGEDNYAPTAIAKGGQLLFALAVQ